MITPGDEIQVEFSASVGDGGLAMRTGECSEMNELAAFEKIDSVLGKSAPEITWMQVLNDGGMRVVEIDAKGIAVPAFVLID